MPKLTRADNSTQFFLFKLSRPVAGMRTRSRPPPKSLTVMRVRVAHLRRDTLLITANFVYYSLSTMGSRRLSEFGQKSRFLAGALSAASLRWWSRRAWALQDVMQRRRDIFFLYFLFCAPANVFLNNRRAESGSFFLLLFFCTSLSQQAASSVFGDITKWFSSLLIFFGWNAWLGIVVIVIILRWFLRSSSSFVVLQLLVNSRRWVHHRSASSRAEWNAIVCHMTTFYESLWNFRLFAAAESTSMEVWAQNCAKKMDIYEISVQPWANSQHVLAHTWRQA